MVNLFEIMRSAQSGHGVANLSRQFGLGPLDTQRALEALLPAFSLGLTRSLYNPAAFGQMLDLVTSGRYAPVFDGSGQPFSAGAGEALTRLLGSKEATRQVAQQAAAATGIGVDVLQQMLPMIAATLIGGLFRYASLQGMGDLLAQWSSAFHQAHAAAKVAEAPPPPSASAIVNPFETWIAVVGPMFGQDKAAEAARAPLDAKPDHALAGALDAWAGIINTMLGGGPGAATGAAPIPAPAAAQNPLQILSQMFESGREVQAQHLANLQGILDGVWGVARTR